MRNMDLGEMKESYLGEMTSKVFGELGEEIEDKKQDMEDLAKRKLSDFGEKVEKVGQRLSE